MITLKSHKIQDTDKDVLSSSTRIRQHCQLRSERVGHAPRFCAQHVIQPHQPCLAGAARTLQDPSGVACSTLMRLTREFREQILFPPVLSALNKMTRRAGITYLEPFMCAKLKHPNFWSLTSKNSFSQKNAAGQP